MAENWNECVLAAGGDYVKVLPCDDVLDRNCIELQAAALDTHVDVDLCSCGKYVIDPPGDCLFRVRSLRDGLHEGTRFIAGSLKRTRNPIGEPGCVLFRRRAFLSSGGFDSQFDYFLDFDLWLRLTATSGLWYDRECLCFYRLHSASGTVALLRSIETDYLRLLDKHASVAVELNRPLTRRWLRLKVRVTSRVRALITTFVVKLSALYYHAVGS